MVQATTLVYLFKLNIRLVLDFLINCNKQVILAVEWRDGAGRNAKGAESTLRRGGQFHLQMAAALIRLLWTIYRDLLGPQRLLFRGISLNKICMPRTKIACFIHRPCAALWAFKVRTGAIRLAPEFLTAAFEALITSRHFNNLPEFR